VYAWNWNVISQYKGVFIQGALVTIWLTLFAIVIGTLLGFALAFLKRSSNPAFSWLAKIYIELFRAIPILVLLIWIFYVVPILLDLRLSPFTAAVVALSINLSAFVAETVRAGIESIHRSQFESGLALGMTSRQVMKRIILPQAVRNMIPNLIGLYITELKNSSLASIIAVNELLHRSNILISNTFRPLEIYTTVAIVYLIIIIPLVWLSRMVERRLIKADKPTFGMDYEISH
jgi:amine acid ABC transporter, permease protein, 3-TM region, His/Glu/Gln/Arg/opine family